MTSNDVTTAASDIKGWPTRASRVGFLRRAERTTRATHAVLARFRSDPMLGADISRADDALAVTQGDLQGATAEAQGRRWATAGVDAAMKAEYDLGVVLEVGDRLFARCQGG